MRPLPPPQRDPHGASLAVSPPPAASAPEQVEGAVPEDDVQLTLVEHLIELRNRLKWAVLGVLGGFVLAFGFSEKIFRWLMDPVFSALPPEKRTLFFTGAVEPLFVYLKVALYAGIFIASPVILYQFWSFVAPGLYRKERRIAGPFVVVGTLCFVAGGAFAHYLVLPFAFTYLVGEFTAPDLVPILTMGEQLGLVLLMTLAFGVIFELPVVITLLVMLRIIRVQTLTKYRRFAIVANVVLAAVITPTGDPFNLALMAVPLIVFYEVGILAAKLLTPMEGPEHESV